MPLNQSHFGAYNAASVELRSSSYSATCAARSEPNGISVFQLQFRVLKDGATLSDVLYLETNLPLAEAYSEGQAPGILYYTLCKPGVTLTQKMVMVRQE